jgi:hypothetical protein
MGDQYSGQCNVGGQYSGTVHGMGDQY